jgi:hypothetical protein
MWHWLFCIQFLYGMCVSLIPRHTYYEYSVWVLKSSMTSRIFALHFGLCCQVLPGSRMLHIRFFKWHDPDLGDSCESDFCNNCNLHQWKPKAWRQLFFHVAFYSQSMLRITSDLTSSDIYWRTRLTTRGVNESQLKFFDKTLLMS